MASTSTATPSMIHLDARLDSFKAVLKPKSRAKPAFPLDPTRYPDLTPTDLANAGFFHDPGPDEDTHDTCKCFICGLKLGGWDETDNPFEEHHKRGSCAWAEFVCGPVAQRAGKTRLVYKTQDDLPSSESSATYREITYQKAWPHKVKAGFQPTVKNLAKAGFVLQATSVSPDGVWCPFCEYGVEGWEADDDPWTIHLKKSPHCDFFTAQLDGVPLAKGKAAKAPRETIKRGQRATEVASQSEAPSDLPDTTDNEPSGSQPKTRRKVPARGKAKRGGETETDLDSAAESQAVLDEQEQVVPVDFGEDEEPAFKPRAAVKGRKGKGKARQTQTQVDAVTETELESQAESVVDTQDEETGSKRGAKKGSRKKTIGSKASSRAEIESSAPVQSEVEPSEVDADEGEDAVVLGKSTRAKGKGTTKRTEAARREKEDAEMESGVDDESAAEVGDAEDRRATIKSGKSKSSKASTATKSSSKSFRTKRAPQDSAAEESEVPVSEIDFSAVEGAESSTEDRRRTLKSTKSKLTRSKKAAEAASEVEQSTVEDDPAPKAKSKSKSTSSRAEKDPATSKSSKSSSSRSKPSARSAPAAAETESEAPSEVEPEPAEPEPRSKSVPAPRKVAPKPRKTKKSSAPPTSAPASVRGPPQPTQMHVLTQLDRFANVPPSSPFPEDSTPKAKHVPTLARPTRSSPAAQLPRETLNASLAQGAAEARAVVEQVVLHVTGADGADAVAANASSASSGKDADGLVLAKLTEEEMQMTLEELVRSEYKKRYEVMQREGEEMIRKWEARSSEARSRIESL